VAGVEVVHVAHHQGGNGAVAGLLDGLAVHGANEVAAIHLVMVRLHSEAVPTWDIGINLPVRGLSISHLPATVLLAFAFAFAFSVSPPTHQ